MSVKGIYVSRLTGNDTKTCGKLTCPCRSISYGIEQLSTGLYIYLDGTATFKSPYICKTLDPGHPGTHLTKNVSFVSIKSRAYISCLHGNPWLVNGTKHKDGVRIRFSGLVFLNTSLRLFNAFVKVNDTVFAEATHVSLNIEVVNLPRIELSLHNVVFQQNSACIRLIPQGSKVFVNMTNTVFYKNGDPSSNIPSTLWLYSTATLINIQLKNCSFEKNVFKEYGMFTVGNMFGTTNVSLNQLKLVENSLTKASPKPYSCLFRLDSARLLLRLDYGEFMDKKFANFEFLTVTGRSAEINISNIEVDAFRSAIYGGVINLNGLDLCYLSIKDSSFRNANNHGDGSILFIDAQKLVLTIQNSTFHNISSSGSGGAVFVQSYPNDIGNSSDFNEGFFVLLRIIDSLFSYSSSTFYGGAVCVYAQVLSVIIRDSSFLRCGAAVSGGALYLSTNDTSRISLQNSYLVENSADDGAIVHADGRREESSFNLSVTNTLFVKNRLYSQKNRYGVVHFVAKCQKVMVDIKHTHFI